MNHDPLNPWWPYHPLAQGLMGLVVALATLGSVVAVVIGCIEGSPLTGLGFAVQGFVCLLSLTYAPVMLLRYFIVVVPRRIAKRRVVAALGRPHERA